MSTLQYFLFRVRANLNQASRGDSFVNAENFDSAKWGLRISLLILAIPAPFHWYGFSALPVRYRPFETFPSTSDVGNGVALIILFALSWLFGTKLLDVITGATHAAFSSKKTFVEWKSVTDAAIRRLPLMACLGSLFWGTWVYYVFWLRFDFVRTSIVVGTLAHLAAATWYIPILVGWYQSDASSKTNLDDAFSQEAGPNKTFPTDDQPNRA